MQNAQFQTANSSIENSKVNSQSFSLPRRSHNSFQSQNSIEGNSQSSFTSDSSKKKSRLPRRSTSPRPLPEKENEIFLPFEHIKSSTLKNSTLKPFPNNNNLNSQSSPQQKIDQLNKTYSPSELLSSANSSSKRIPKKPKIQDETLNEIREIRMSPSLERVINGIDKFDIDFSLDIDSDSDSNSDSI